MNASNHLHFLYISLGEVGILREHAQYLISEV